MNFRAMDMPATLMTACFQGKIEDFYFCIPGPGELFARPGDTKIPLLCQGEQITLNRSG